MKSMIETTSVMHQRNIKLLLAPGETRLELPSPDGASSVVVTTPKTDSQDNFFVEILTKELDFVRSFFNTSE
jgi:hypothetical protein